MASCVTYIWRVCDMFSVLSTATCIPGTATQLGLSIALFETPNSMINHDSEFLTSKNLLPKISEGKRKKEEHQQQLLIPRQLSCFQQWAVPSQDGWS